tara:strand:- start:812 stop:1111 length:300 start_codon:yes stop_codon:yes gene_type:complete
MTLTIDYQAIIVFLCIFSLLFSLVALILSGIAVVKVLAMEKATHSVTYMPIDPEIDKANEEWATSQGSLDKQNKADREDVEDEMPMFALEDEDKKIHSF